MGNNRHQDGLGRHRMPSGNPLDHVEDLGRFHHYPLVQEEELPPSETKEAGERVPTRPTCPSDRFHGREAQARRYWVVESPRDHRAVQAVVDQLVDGCRMLSRGHCEGTMRRRRVEVEEMVMLGPLLT